MDERTGDAADRNLPARQGDGPVALGAAERENWRRQFARGLPAASVRTESESLDDRCRRIALCKSFQDQTTPRRRDGLNPGVHFECLTEWNGQSVWVLWTLTQREETMRVDLLKRALLAGVLFAGVVGDRLCLAGQAGYRRRRQDWRHSVVQRHGGGHQEEVRRTWRERVHDWARPAPTPALQVRAIEDLIAQKVDVIGVVPNDAEVLEPVLARARAAGIKVITHESPKQINTDYDFELASAKGFGEAYGKTVVRGAWRQGRICRLRRFPHGSSAQRLGGRGDRLYQGQRSRHEAGWRSLWRPRKTSISREAPPST